MIPMKIKMKFKRAPKKFSRRALFEWLKKQNPRRRFNYFSQRACFFASFFRETYGPDWRCRGRLMGRDRGGITVVIPSRLTGIIERLNSHFTINQVRRALEKENITK